MEASAAGLAAGGEGGQADGAAAATGDGQGQQGNGNEATIAAFQESLNDSLTAQQEAFRQQLEDFASQQQAGSQESQPQQQAQVAAPAADLGFLADPDPAKAAQGLQDFMANVARTEAQKIAAEAVAPLSQQQQEMRLDQESAALVAEIPELGKPEVAQPVIDEAHRQATMLGHPELVSDANFIKTVYLSQRAQELAKQQQAGAAGGSGVATLEGAGGAGPGGAQQGAERTAATVAANFAGRTNVLSKL